jgi:putative ABC transport system substrate-binding protein
MRRRRWLGLVGSAWLLVTPFMCQTEAAGKVWRVGVLDSRPRPESLGTHWLYGQLIGRLRELGYVEGENLSLEWRFGESDYRRLPDLAADLVRQEVDVIVTVGSEGIRAAQNATRTIPIVFSGGTDVVAQGFVRSLARPGGNTTGVTIQLVDTAE